MSFTKNDLDQIKSKISIRLELEKNTTTIQKGKDSWCCRPFHEEKTPSCKINEDPGSFYCFGCGAKGDIFTIYTDLYNYNFIDAVKELAQRSGVEIKLDDSFHSQKNNNIEKILELSCLWFQENLEKFSAENCNLYLQKRKLTNQTIQKFRLGFSYNSETSLYNFLKNKSFKDDEILESSVVKIDKKDKIRDFFYKRLVFPIMNAQDKVVGFGGRAIDGSNPKYINSPESKFFQKRNLLYNLNNAKHTARKKNNLLICEGYMDVISLYQNGILSVVAPLGTSLTEDQLALSWRYSSKPTIMFDGDSAGVRASYKSAIMALPFISAKQFLQFISLPNGYDPDTYINELSLNSLIHRLKSPEQLVQFIFNQSSKSLSLHIADEKITYDKYLDDLIETIKDQKTKYFYKNEFKSLFFNKIKEILYVNKKKTSSNKKINVNLNKKQNLSFISTSINNLKYRKSFLEELIKVDLFDEIEIKLIKELQKKELILLKKDEILNFFDKSQFNELLKELMNFEVYQLFPYASPSFDPQLSYQEALKSLNNLNTRLLNLKKINKSLDTFVNDSNPLNWNELQSINLEVIEKD